MSLLDVLVAAAAVGLIAGLLVPGSDGEPAAGPPQGREDGNQT